MTKRAAPSATDDAARWFLITRSTRQGDFAERRPDMTEPELVEGNAADAPLCEGLPSVIDELDQLPARRWHLLAGDQLGRREDYVRRNTHFGPEEILETLLEAFVSRLAGTDQDAYAVRADGVGVDFDDVVRDFGHVVEDVVEGGRIERCALEFDHLPFATDDRADA